MPVSMAVGSGILNGVLQKNENPGLFRQVVFIYEDRTTLH